MDPGEKCPSATPSRQLVNSPTAFTITLESVDDLDSFIIREFSLPLNSTFPIGRASSNTQKRHLMSAHDNGFIDSPVVSREHAVLSANSDTGRPRVYLTDSHSMHGTMVNNDKLEPHKPRQLSNGDLLQFGADVNRNESSFLARKYRVRAALLPTKMDSFAHGFTVPEAESSDEEEVEGAAHTEANAVPPLPPRYGSQKNPVTIDDSEGPSRTVIEIHDDPVVEKQPLAKKDPSPAPRSLSLPATQPSPQLAIYGDSESEFGGASSMDAMSISMYSSSEEEEQGLEDDEDEIEDELEDELDDDASDVSSDVVPDSLESEIKGRESIDADAVRRMKLEAMLNHERQKVTEELPKPTTASASRPPPERTPIALSSPSLQVNADQQIESFYVPQDLSPLGMMDNPFADMFSAAPPLPPRPSATKPPIWGGDFTTSLPARENTWWAGEPALPVSYMGTNFGDRPVLFSPAPPPPSVDPMQPKPLTQNWAPTTPPSEANDNKQTPEELRNQIPSAAEMQSPPSMPLDVPTLSPPQHRTKVTISEIVEDHPSPPNPPSPASITSHKRKADVLEDNEENAQDTGSPLPGPAAVNDVASIQGRPKKRLRSRIGSALTTAAAYVVPGTAVAMGLFMYLPDSFFNE